MVGGTGKVTRPTGPADGQSHRARVVAAIPAYNEEGSIGQVVEESLRYVDRVFVIDDGSLDKTSEIATNAGATVFRHLTNRGYGASIKACLALAIASDADILVVLDGDGQHRPSQIPHVIHPVLLGQADIVIGSRFLGDYTSMPQYRRFGIRVITWLFNVGCPVKLTDAQSGFRAYNRKAVSHLLAAKSLGMGISTETIILARHLGLRISEVPISCTYGPNSSTENPIRHGLSVAFTTALIRLNVEVLRRHRQSNTREEALPVSTTLFGKLMG